MRYKTIALSALFALYASSVFAGGAGTSGGAFLRVPVGARAPGMGGGFSALADDASAIYYNPAGLAQLEKKEVSLSYNAYIKDTASQFLGYANPYSKGAWALSVNALSVSDIEKRSATAGDADTPDLGTFKTQDLAGSLAYARKLNDNLNLGLSLKYISSDLGAVQSGTSGDAKAAAFAADLGALYKFNDNLQASLAVLNLGTELKFVDEGDPLPLNVKPGIAYKHKFESYGQLNAVLDADYLVNDQLFYANPGFEYWPLEQFAFRAGYTVGRDSDVGGLGLGVGFRHSSLAVDYAFVPMGNLGTTHRVGLGLKF